MQEIGYSLSDEEVNRAFTRFKDLADKKKEITSFDLESIVNDEIRDANMRRYELVDMQVFVWRGWEIREYLQGFLHELLLYVVDLSVYRFCVVMV